MTTPFTADAPMSAARWARGQTVEQFVDQIDTYQAETRRRLASVQLRAEDQYALASLTTPRYVLALTEGWCGDSLMNLPIVTRIAAALPNATLRVFVRSAEPELAAVYAARDIRAIPVFTFFDSTFHEIGTWVERSQAAHARMAQWRAENPAYDSIRTDGTLTQTERHARLAPIVAPLVPAMEAWYAETLQAATVAEILALLRRES